MAATLALGVGLALARTQRERSSERRRRSDRKLGLRRGEQPGAALKRMALAQAELAIELLGGGGEGGLASVAPPDERAVHETRKAIKRLRALVRLVRGELGEQAFARENTALRDVARQLAGARDAEVMLSTLDALVERHPRKLRRRGVRRLRKRLLAERAKARRRSLEDPAARAAILAELHAFRVRAAGWQLEDGPGIALVEGDLARLYRQGRRRHRRARRGKGRRAVTMHEWRKRVKDLRYALEMLDRRGSGRRLRRLAGRADELAEVLGEEHDLAMLAARLRTGRRRKASSTWHTGARTRGALLKVTARRRRKLRRRALTLGPRLYADKPERFARRVRSAYRHEAGDALR